jgi:hypothetical protein
MNHKYVFFQHTGKRQLQLRVVLRGGATVLGDAASENELFLTEDLLLRYAVASKQP